MQNENEILWTAAFLNERFTSVVSPLGWSFVGSLFEQLALRDPLRYMGAPDADTLPALRLWHGHPYVNVEIFSTLYKPFPDAFVPTDAVRYFPQGDLTYRRHSLYPRSMFQPRLLLSLAFHLLRDPIVTSPLNYQAWERFVPYHDARIRELERELESATNAQQVLGVIDAAYALDEQLLHIHRWSLTYADLLYKFLMLWRGSEVQGLMSNVPNKTREVNAELAALAHMPVPLSAELVLRITGQKPLNAHEQTTADALDTFLERHGHRAFSLDIAQPTFRDDPTQLLAFVRHADETAGPAFTTPGEFVTRNPLVALARHYARLREDQRYYWQKSLAVARAAYLVLGRDLHARDLLAQASDIFYATRSEITAYYGMDLEPHVLAATIAARKREWSSYMEMDRRQGARAYPPFLRGAMPLEESVPTETKRVEWHGRGVSQGVVRGVARIVQEPRELGRVGAGEILVAPSTDPAWTPVFGRLGGLVMERGGVLSHGAVVAREYHLPAVTAIPNVTHLLQDGEWIELNGTEGIVRRIPN